MQVEKMYQVTIDKVTPKFDAQNNLTSEDREELVNKRMSGITPIVAVIKVYESAREGIKDVLGNLEISVDGRPFQSA